MFWNLLFVSNLNLADIVQTTTRGRSFTKHLITGCNCVQLGSLMYLSASDRRLKGVAFKETGALLLGK